MAFMEFNKDFAETPHEHGNETGRAAWLLLLIFLFLLCPFSSWSQEPAFYPDDPYFLYDPVSRPGFPGQWHLFNTGPSYIDFYSTQDRTTERMFNARVDAGLRQAWGLGYTGKGVVIGIVDDGVDGSSYDIAPGYRADLSRNFSSNKALSNAPQGPQFLSDNHGTAVAGVAAARGGNGIGGTGAAPYASIAGLRINLGTDTADDPKVSTQNYLDAYYWKSGVNPVTGVIEGAPEIQVKNHSYGADGYDTANADIRLALQRTARNGVIHVFSAGNARGRKGEDASKEPVHASSDVIVAAALGSDGRYSNYSSYGASVFVTAPSNRSDYTGFGITTTDREGEYLGYNRYSALNNPKGDRDDLFPDTSYASLFGGTSSSAPLVSGIMALGKEANPEMDVRMAKHALVKTSTVVDADDESDSSFGGWRANAAGNRFNPNYGFGNINAGAFVQKVRNVAYITDQTSVTKSLSFSEALPDGNAAGVSKTMNLTAAEAGQPLEGVEVGIKVNHTRLGDLTAMIKSPSGMESRLIYSTSHLESAQWETASTEGKDFSASFLSNAFWGEAGSGNWVLNVADIDARVTGAGTAEETTGTGNWLGYDVTFLMGQMVLLTPGVMTQGVDINAQSLSLLNPGTTYVIPAGRTFRVRNNVLVDGGSLVVNGQITEAPGAFGNRFGLYSGTVGGTGAITASRGFYNSGGTLSPGNSVGTLTINGNFNQLSQGSLLIEIASTASRDLLQINGTANLGGRLQTLWTGGYIPALNTQFGTFLTASGGVVGRFEKVYTNISPTIVFQPKYDIANQLYFVVERDYINDSLSLTRNQRSVGAMLNAVANGPPGMSGDLNTVLNLIDALPSGMQVGPALDQLAPRNEVAISGMAISGSAFQAGNIAGRLGELRAGARGTSFSGLRFDDEGLFRDNGRLPVVLAANNGAASYIPPPLPDDRWGMFARGNAVIGDQRGSAERTGYNFTNTGATMGMDYRFSESAIAGVMLGVNTSRAKLDDAGSRVRMDGASVGTYGTYYSGGFFLDGQLSYGLNRYDNSRRIVFPGIDRTATSDPGGNMFSAYGGTGYDFKPGSWIITPSFSLQYTRLAVDEYTEAGADSLNLRIDSQTASSLQGNMGARMAYVWETAPARVMPNIHASYVHEFCGNSRTVAAQLAQVGVPFTVQTASPSQSSLVAGAGLTGEFKNGMSLYLNYDAQIGQDSYLAHSIYAGLRVVF